jgi:hypothetical protein
MDDEGVVHTAVDVRPTQLGDVLGELNRTGWEITGGEEFDEERRDFVAGCYPEPSFPAGGISKRRSRSSSLARLR